MTIFPEHFDQDLLLEQVTVANEITLTFHATSPTAMCPECGTISTRIQSRYRRTIHDLPNRGRPVHLVLHVRRFRCHKSTCGRKIFAEQFPTLTRLYAQRSIQLQEALRQIGMVLGGHQAGTRLGEALGLSGSRDTILRLVRTSELPATAAPKKVGIDDWAWKRGHRYGTLVCDLERGIPIDLLPDRTVETVAAWFVAHPSIDLISRDGSYEYAAAALKALLTFHFTAHRKRKTQERDTQKEIAFPRERSARLSPQQAHIQRLHRDDRLARYNQMIALAKQGMRRRAIADQVGVGLTTIQNWLQAGTFPERKPREQSSQLDLYQAYVQKRQSEGYHNLMGIYRELQGRGYRGSYENVRVQFGNLSQRARSNKTSHAPLTHALPSSQQACWLFLRRPEDFTVEEQATVMRLRQLHPEIELAYTFVQQFTHMLRTRTGEKLAGWLEAVTQSPLTDLRSFAGSVSEDKEAILAGLTREESNGLLEGHVNRLKLIKRSMYGRAKFDLLRLRVLHHPEKREVSQEAKTEADHKRRRNRIKKLRAEENTLNSQHTTVRISKVA